MLMIWPPRQTRHAALERAFCGRHGHPGLPSPADGSSQQYIPGIRTPTLWLVARDDPFVAVIPADLCLANPAIAMAETSRGGHVAFLEGAHLLARLRSLQSTRGNSLCKLRCCLVCIALGSGSVFV